MSKDVVVRGATSATSTQGQKTLSGVVEGLRPSYPAALFELGTSGGRSYLSRLRGGGRDWHFTAAALWTLHLWNRGSRVVDVVLTPASFTTEAMTVTAGGFTGTWTGVTALAGDASTVTMTAVLDAEGQVRVTDFVVTLDTTPGHQGATHGFGYVDPLVVRPLAYVQVDPSKQQLVVPAWSGFVYRNSCANTAQLSFPYPGLRSGFPEMEHTDPGLANLHAQWIALEERSSRSLLVLRCDDQDGRGKTFRHQGLTTGAELRFRGFPENNLDATTWTMPYEVTLRSMAGDWWDVASWYLGRVEAEAAPFLSRLKLKDRGSSPNPTSLYWFEAELFLWAQLDNSTPAFQVEEARRIQAFAATIGVTKMVVRLDGANPGGMATAEWPESTLTADGIATMSGLLGLSLPVLAYWIDHWAKTGAWFLGGYNPGFGNPAGYLKQDHLGVDVEVNLPPTHALPNYDVANARGHALDQASHFWRTDGFVGIYSDADTGRQEWDYRPALSDADTGPGSAAFIRGVRARLDEFLTDIRTVEAEGFILSEHAAEWGLDRVDGVGAPTNFYGLGWTGLDVLPIWPSTFGEYQTRYGYDIYGAFPPGTPADYYEAFFWNAAQSWLFGKVQGIVANPIANGHVVLEPGDPDYAVEWPIRGPYLAFLMRLAASSVSYGLAPYFRGRRLRPLPGSFDRWIEENGLDAAFGLTGDGLFIRPLHPAGMAAIWQHKETTDEPIAIPLVNPSASDVDFEIILDPAAYPLVRNDGGNGKKKHFLVEVSDGGTRTLVKRYGGVLRHTVTIPARGFRVFELLEAAP